MMPRNRYHAFISYSHADEPIVKPAAQLLRLWRRRVFWDTEIQPGEQWAERIERAISASDQVIVFWCCHSAQSEWVSRETELARAASKPLTPVLLCKYPAQHPLSSYQWIDLTICNHPCLDHPGVGADISNKMLPLLPLLDQEFGLRSLEPEHVAEAWRRHTAAHVTSAYALGGGIAGAGLLTFAQALTGMHNSGSKILSRIVAALGGASLCALGLSIAKGAYESAHAEYNSQLLALVVDAVIRRRSATRQESTERVTAVGVVRSERTPTEVTRAGVP
jgi:hypothetical protein